ncbi:MAG: BREX system ATP-binding protein BrxD [Deltaproteobacteria bacterium]|nr:BREX system ATP-binding protein BrxD [Deltaproteobacteria bacterium]
MTISARDVQHIFEQLRSGLVPERGLDEYAVGVEGPRGEIRRQLALAESGEGRIKFLRGGYGCGKTFMARLAVQDAQAANFATSFVVVSDNDLKFHKFDDVYRKVVSELGTARCPRGALGDILDRWFANVEEGLLALGHDEEAPDFRGTVRKALAEQLASATAQAAPPDFVRVIQTIFDLKEAGEYGSAGALLSWLGGSGNVAAQAKTLAKIKGDIESRDALGYLRGIVAIVKAAGYDGLVVVVDEAETILRMRKDSRHKSLNGIRQIADAAKDFPRLLWLFTGTPEFFDSQWGVRGLQPLHDRIKFQRDGTFVSLRQPQLELTPFDEVRLLQVARRLRAMYLPSSPESRDRLDRRVDDAFVLDMVKAVTAGFGGDVGVVPRQFLREFVGVLDRVDENADYAPNPYAFRADAGPVTPEEQERLTGRKIPVDGADELMAAEDSW